MKKILIAILVLFLMLLAAVELYVQSDSFAARIRPLVVEPLQAILGPEARIGFVKANFLPPYLEVRDLSIPDPSGRETIAIRKIIVYLNPVPLLLKKIRLPAITILEPRIFAVRKADGSYPIQALLEEIRARVASKRTGGAQGYSLLLRTITIRKGAIQFRSDAAPAQVDVGELNMSVTVNVAGDRVAVAVKNSEIRLTAPAYPTMVGKFKAAGEYDQGRFHLDFLDLTSQDAALTLSGDVGSLPTGSLDLKGGIRSGPRTLGKLAELLKPTRKQKESRIEASYSIKGTIADPQVDGGFRIAGVTVRDFTLQDARLNFRYREHALEVNGENWHLVKSGRDLTLQRLSALLAYRQGGVDIQRLEVAADDDLSAHIEGRADPSIGLAVSVNVASSGEGRSLAFLTGMPVAGPVAITGTLSGPFDDPVFSGSLRADAVTVRKGFFDKVRGEVGYRRKVISFSSVEIGSRESHYVLDGTVDLGGNDPVFSARLQVLQSDVVSIVALFYEPLPLTLSAKGVLSFQGTTSAYTGSGYLTLGAGSVYDESFTRGTITASLSTGKISFPQVVLYKKQGMVKATGWIGFDGTYSADIEGSDLPLSAIDHLAGMQTDGTVALEMHSSGTFAAPIVKASLDVDELSVRQAPLGKTHVGAELKDGDLRITAGFPDNRARIASRWTLRKPFPWTAEVTVQSEKSDLLRLLGNKEIADRMNMFAGGTITLQGRGLNLSSVRGEAIFDKVGMLLGDYRIDNDAPVSLSFDGGKVSIRSFDFSGPGTHIGVNGTVALFSSFNLAISGVADLSLLKLLYREVEHAAGTADLQLTVKDDWKNPDVAGALRIANGEIKIKDVPQKFTAMHGTISFAQGRIVTESLTGEMGGGTMAVMGWVQLSGIALQEFSLKASVDNVTVRYPEGLTSTLSGDLYYDGSKKEQVLSGDVAIKRARYDKRIEWKSMLVEFRRGLYQKKKTDIAWIGDTQINLRFHGRDNIVFQNNLATMSLDVDMFLRGTVNHPQVLGRIETRNGSVYFRKNDFKILHASADLVDPNRMNPVLDIQAETQVRDYRIQLSVTGTADRATVTFVSDPPLIDSDILSLLALGKTGPELAGKETTVGVGEAVSFASGHLQDIIESRTRSLTGLDRFQVDPYVSKNDTSVPRVTVGKELIQNKLYVTYSSNVAAAASEPVFSIEYILNRHFSLVGERDDMGNNGADIKYRFEFE